MAAITRYEIDIIQRLQSLLKRRLNFEHHPVQIRLREDGRDQALTEGVIQRVIDCRGRDSQPRSGVAIDFKVSLQPLVL